MPQTATSALCHGPLRHEPLRPGLRHLRLAALIGLALVATGCAIQPKPLTRAEVDQRVRQDRLQLYGDQEPVRGPIGVDEAVARALKYNLDHRLKLMETALASGLADLSRYDMLPSLLTSAGYAWRDNLNGSRSFRIEDDRAIDSDPPTYTGGSERNRRLASAEFSWNVLDFGVGYYRARQQADQFLIAEERRARVVQNIVQDTRSAWWRAMGAQRLMGRAEALAQRVQLALARSREAQAQGLLSPRDALTSRRMLLDAVQLLAARRQELEFAKLELAALMNVPAGTAFTLAEADEPPLAALPRDLTRLEDLALQNRPELREEDLRVRITADEARRQLLTLLPNLGLNVGSQYDSNAYLYNNSWVDASLRVSFNLLRTLSLPSMKRAQAAQQQADQARRLALSMAVLTQVRVAAERYRLALADLDIARESGQVDGQLAEFARAAQSTRVDSELETIRAEMRAINSEYQRHAAYAAAQAALARVSNSVGLEALPPQARDTSVSGLSLTLAGWQAQIEAEAFDHAAPTAAGLPPIGLCIVVPAALRGQIDEAGLRQAAAAALARHRIAVGEQAAPTAGLLLMTLEQAPAPAGVIKADWRLAMQQSDGSIAGRGRYSSTLPADAAAPTWRAFTEAAVVAHAAAIGDWLQQSASR